MEQDTIIKLELPLADVNQILTQLGKGKYSQVAVLISKIQTLTLTQVNSQIPNLTEDKKDV